jgi:hypothetical protein
MRRPFQRLLLALMIAGAANSAKAFSLLGPYASWQTPELSYNVLNTDVGGPMNLGEEYRWNIKTVTYGIDESFLNYFGQRGVDELNKAIAILNNVPTFSSMSSNLAEYPMDTRRSNYRASALPLLDLKSHALATLVEEMGLASPDRYVWTLRARTVINSIPYYTVIKRNFDPVTWAPSSYVNGVLYTYIIQEFTAPINPWADAVEVIVDPLAQGYTAVVSAADDTLWGPGLGFGEFFVGLTRDDVGGLRYLYRPTNYNIEDLIPGTTGGGLFIGGGGGDPWAPPGGGGGGGGFGGSNNVVTVALRPGVNHITFQQGQYDSLFGNFITLTNQYQDTYVTNSTLATQTTERILTQPDILFAAEDIGLTTIGTPVGWVRTDTSGWINNDALNGQAALAGPGVISPQIVITFSKIGPWLYNDPSFVDESNPLITGFVWGSFDGTTNAPIVYPIGSSIQDLERQVLGGD